MLSAHAEGKRRAPLSMRQVPSPCGGSAKTITVGVADCDELRTKAHILINRMYSWRGYGADHLLVDGDHRATFTASVDDDVMGTLTLTVDTPAGLSTDHSFKAELDEFRRVPGTRLCELTKFAVDPTTKSPAVLAALFHVIFIYGMQRFDCTDLVIEVHPRHVRYYEAMLGFERIGPPKIDASVKWWPSDTPVQLMHLKISDIRREIDQHAGKSAKEGRSLYPYFFGSEEEKLIAARVGKLWKDHMPLQAPHAHSMGAGPSTSPTGQLERIH
jgi:hypothetical protein